jgi:hypothetical protein
MQQCLLGNQELMPVIGNFPISTLAAFPGLGSVTLSSTALSTRSPHETNSVGATGESA